MKSQVKRALGRVGVACSALVFTSTAVVAASSGPALANNALPLNAPLMDFAHRAMPQWNFARANGNDTCWPAPAIPDGKQNPGASPNLWPDTDSGCKPRYSFFPTYVSVKKCSDQVVRASYTLYFPKDGFVPGGHKHDFESIIVEWRKRSNGWTRERLLMSRHGKWVARPWSRAESWNSDRGSAGLGREYPRIFVGFGKHAMFNDQKGLKDIASTTNDLEYRSADYPVWAHKEWRLVNETTIKTLPHLMFDKYNWGSATTTPAVVLRNLCGFQPSRTD